MPTPSAGELARTPMSPNLAATLARASDSARARAHREVTLEHLLLALTEDPDAGQILLASNIDIARLAASVGTHLSQIESRFPDGQTGELSISAELRSILESAAAAAQQSRRSDSISGAIVLAAIIGEGQSTASHLLRAQGLTFDAAMRALQRAVAEAQARRAGAAPSPAPAPSPSPAAPASVANTESILASARERVQTRSLPATPPVEASAPQSPASPAGPPPPTYPAAPPREPDWSPSQPLPPQSGAMAGSLPGQPVTSWVGPPPGPANGRPGEPANQWAGGVLSSRPEPPARTRERPGRSGAQLRHNIPARMRVADAVLAEARIAKVHVKALVESLDGGGAAYRQEIMVTRAISVRLRAPDGGFWIENLSPETQWIENAFGIIADEHASWRWAITPKARGRQRLVVMISARTVGTDGLAAETALPDQPIEIRVRPHYAAALSRALWLALALIAAGLVGYFAESLYATGLALVDRLAS